MIAIKTRMRRIPPCCQVCQLYISSAMYGEGCCGGVLSRGSGYPKGLCDVKVSKERADFCPLVKVNEPEEIERYKYHGH